MNYKLELHHNCQQQHQANDCYHIQNTLLRKWLDSVHTLCNFLDKQLILRQEILELCKLMKRKYRNSLKVVSTKSLNSEIVFHLLNYSKKGRYKYKRIVSFPKCQCIFVFFFLTVLEFLTKTFTSNIKIIKFFSEKIIK